MRLRNIVIGGAILSILAGFVMGKTVLGDAPPPGSSADPVVSKSYVDKALQDQIKDLEKQVAELTAQSQALVKTVNELQAKVNKTATPIKAPTTPSTSTPSTPQKPPATSVVGKTAYVVQSNNFVNLRKGASTDTEAIGRVNKGEAMTIQEVKDNWYKVKTASGTIGWVAGWLVEVK